MRKVFIDCGTHFFEGFEKFLDIFKMDKMWEYYCFEANPITFLKSKNIFNKYIDDGYNIVYKNLAISDNDGYVRINCQINDGGTGLGSNILKNPPKYDIEYNVELNYIEKNKYIESINFSNFLNNNFKTEDYIVIKMDIEGAEFEVLDSIIKNTDIKIINKIYVEFHERFFDNIELYIEKKNNYKKIFLENNIELVDWI